MSTNNTNKISFNSRPRFDQVLVVLEKLYGEPNKNKFSIQDFIEVYESLSGEKAPQKRRSALSTYIAKLTRGTLEEISRLSQQDTAHIYAEDTTVKRYAGLLARPDDRQRCWFSFRFSISDVMKINDNFLSAGKPKESKKCDAYTPKKKNIMNERSLKILQTLSENPSGYDVSAIAVLAKSDTKSAGDILSALKIIGLIDRTGRKWSLTDSGNSLVKLA